jgi:hypothetical protein
MAFPVSTRTTGTLITASIWNSDLVDNLNAIINSSGNLAISGTGPHAIGGAVDANVQLRILGTLAPSTTGVVVDVASTVNAVANQDVYGMFLRPTIVEAGSGTHALFASAVIAAPTITAGAATLGGAATLYLSGVPSGASNTYALLIETGSDDGIHVALSSSDVTHGVTSLAPTTVYGLLRKASATEGGLSIQGYSEGDTSMKISGVATSVVTTETGGSNGNIMLIAEVKSGTSTTTHAADDNIVVFKNNVNATHIFKGNGDSYEDGTGWTAYDDEDDHALIDALDHVLDPSLRSMRADAAQWLTENEAALERLRIVSFNRDTDGHPYVNKSRLAMLHNGALRLAVRRIAELEQRLDTLEAARG